MKLWSVWVHNENVGRDEYFGSFATDDHDEIDDVEKYLAVECDLVPFKANAYGGKLKHVSFEGYAVGPVKIGEKSSDQCDWY